MKQLFDYSSNTLQKWEEKGRLQPGTHFICIDGGQWRYNVALMEGLLVNWDDWTAHQKAIHNYFTSLPSNQRSRKTS